MTGRTRAGRIAGIMLWALALASGAGCAHGLRGASGAAGDEIALYRDHALIAQRLEVAAPRAGRIALAIALPPDVDPDRVTVLDRGELSVIALRGGEDSDAEPSGEPDAGDVSEASAPALSRAPSVAGAATLELAAPRAGRFRVELGYATERLAWDAAYTMTTTPARDRASLRGTIAIRNTTGLALRGRIRVLDAELGAGRDRSAEQLRAALASGPRDTAPYEIGDVLLGAGETRIELLGGAAPRGLRSVLVYDPVGRAIDHAGAMPVSDPGLGAGDASTQIRESFEIERDRHAPRGLPAGPVRLVERRADGAVELLGEARLFDAATRVADVDTIAVGTARDVVGHRVRRDWAKDDDQRRFSEEFLVTIDNARPRPVELVLREHLYRGQNWTLAYQSVPALKEGPQQIALRTTVPARGRAEVLYVVVYTW